MKMMHEIRGFRNNNPGNIEKSMKGLIWEGEVEYINGIQSEERFCQFCNIDYGIRAIFKILRTYREKHDLFTIEDIISRWAPSTENHTDKYIDSVCNYINRNAFPGIAKTSQLSTSLMPLLVEAIIIGENGFNPILHEYIIELMGWAIPDWKII